MQNPYESPSHAAEEGVGAAQDAPSTRPIRQKVAIGNGEKLALAYGALSGFFLAYFASRNLVFAIAMIPGAVFGIGCALALNRIARFNLVSPPYIGRRRRVVIAFVIVGTLAIAAAKSYLDADLFGALVTALLIPPACYLSYLNVLASPDV